MAPPGSGKSTSAALFVAREGSTCWLCDRNQDVDETATRIQEAGGTVGRVIPLRGKSLRMATDPDSNKKSVVQVDNCLHPDIIEKWQDKGYDYRRGFCPAACERKASPQDCPYLQSIDQLKDADTIVVTKARARMKGFFGAHGNDHRMNVVIDEDAVGFFRPEVEITRAELDRFIPMAEEIERRFLDEGHADAASEAARTLAVARWCWESTNGLPPGPDPNRAPLPRELRLRTPREPESRRFLKDGQDRYTRELHRRMREDPDRVVRNVYRDLLELATRCAGNSAYATAMDLMFHVRVSIPATRRIVLLDATARPDLLKRLLPRRKIEIVGDQRVQPTGRIIQFMDGNYPRVSVRRAIENAQEGGSSKLIKLIDAIGDRHPKSAIALISFKEHVHSLRLLSRHTDRIKTAYFGAVRGRNDLQDATCHIVVGSPKAPEVARQRLALAVYGEKILPFQKMVVMRRPIQARMLREQSPEGNVQLWESKGWWYEDPRMQAIYEHTVTSELLQAADRARVLMNPAVVYLITNEPVPELWYAELCFARDLLGTMQLDRADFRRNNSDFAAVARMLLDRGDSICGADVCLAMNRKPTWGKRYWRAFVAQNAAMLIGDRKMRWKNSDDMDMSLQRGNHAI